MERGGDMIPDLSQRAATRASNLVGMSRKRFLLAASGMLGAISVGGLASRKAQAAEGVRTLASASAPAREICAVRILTDNATDLYKMMNRCREISRSFLDLPPPSRPIS